MRVLIFALTFLLSSCSIQLFAPQSTSTSSIPNFFVVGQENSNVSYQNKVAFGSTNQIIQAAGRYIIVDAQKNRILIYNQFPTSSIAELTDLHLFKTELNT
jgi:predicted Abi (CAAX) family protease